jgi:hypothetical protein
MLLTIYCYNAAMPDQAPKREFVLRNGFAASCEFDPASKTFDFLVDNGSHEVYSFPNATREEVSQLIKDIRACVPAVSKGEQRSA